MNIKLPEWLVRASDRFGRWPLSDMQTLAAGVVAFVIGFGLYLNCGVGGCPDIRQLSAYQPGGAPELLDRHGKKFADLAPYERVVVRLDSLPEYVPSAFVAVEDRRFWDHNGVDWIRVFGAALANVRSRGVAQGSSTITMQLARNVFPKELPGSQRTMKRKLQEARVARQIERNFEKREILEMYLNHIYFGGGAYGIEAASRLYFNRYAKRITLAQAAALAALPKAPAHYDPRRRPERSAERRAIVLTLMEQQGYIDAEQAEEAREADINTEANGSIRGAMPLGAYYIDVVRGMLEDRFGEELYREKLRIFTTLDPVAQRAAERELEAQLKRLDGRVRDGEGPLQGALVLMDAHTGGVLALVGGRDPASSRYNRATRAQRQVGSAFKPFVYATALHEGVPTSRLVSDAPYSLRLSGNDVWEPKNYDGTYEGDMPLRQALVESRNVPTVRLASDVGIDDVADLARSAGVTAEMDETPALALGTVAMSPLQLATAYTTFATLGTTAEPLFVQRVEDADGNVLWSIPETRKQSGLEPAVAYIINDVLKDAVNYGTGTGVRSAGYYGIVAGKTGTTNNATDAWFVGYTPEVVGTVWIGYDQPSSLGSAATGGGFAAPVLGRVLRDLYEDRSVRDWEVPAGVARYYVDPFTGLVLADGCQPEHGIATSELFTPDNIAELTCPYQDWWGQVWDRVQDVFDGKNDRGRNSPPPPANPRGRGADDARERERQMEEFMRERSERLRRGNNGRGNGNGRGNAP